MDGGSTDGTFAILNKYPHIIWRSGRDRGQSDALNKAFRLCTGDVIVCLNADDYLEEGVFEKVAAAFRRHSDVDLLIGNGTHVSPDGKTGEWHSEATYDRCLQFYKYQFPVNPVSYFYRRKVQEAIGYNVQNHYTMDYEFLLRAFQLFKTKKLEENFGYFYQDGSNKTANMERAYQNLKKTLIRHCVKHDPGRVPSVLHYFLKKKLYGRQ